MEYPEIMAPAGDFASLTAALQGGANSVFFGVGKLNMRSGSNINFTLEDLPQVVAQCHQSHAKAYLTANTIVYNSELDELQQLLQAAAKAGVDAVIASDQAAIVAARANGLPVHISTQLSISNTLALQFYSQWADVVVLARELTLEQIGEIAHDIEQQRITGPSGKLVRIEAFAHGALCMAISGKCYLSLHDAHRSANRGACVQICRRSYTLTDTETGNAIEVDNQYLMSPKDLCTIGIIDRMIGAGISVLKIEGRARSPEYVRTVTECYREAAQACVRGTYTPKQVSQWKGRLRGVFNRGFWEGYYLGQKMGEWSVHYGSAATERKQSLGVITNYFRRARVAEIKVEAAELHEGAQLYIIGPTSGVITLEASGMRVDDVEVPCVAKGQTCSLRVRQLVRRGDKVFLRIPVAESPAAPAAR